jgi:hypothetical protein
MTINNPCYICLNSTPQALTESSELVPINAKRGDSTVVLRTVCSSCAVELRPEVYGPSRKLSRPIEPGKKNLMVLLSEIRAGVDMLDAPDYAFVEVTEGMIASIKSQAQFAKEQGVFKLDSFTHQAQWSAGQPWVWGKSASSALQEGQMHVTDSSFWFSAYPHHENEKVCTFKFDISVLDMPEVNADCAGSIIETLIVDDVGHSAVRFNAAPWFAQATDEQIKKLAANGWAGSQQADAVAEFFRSSNDDIKKLFAFCEASCEAGDGSSDIGFCVNIDDDQAMTWLKEKRYNLWAWLKVGRSEVSIFYPPTDDPEQGFKWINADVTRSGFASAELAALDAVSVLKLL